MFADALHVFCLSQMGVPGQCILEVQAAALQQHRQQAAAAQAWSGSCSMDHQHAPSKVRHCIVVIAHVVLAQGRFPPFNHVYIEVFSDGTLTSLWRPCM